MQNFIVILLFFVSFGTFIPLSGGAAEGKPETTSIPPWYAFDRQLSFYDGNRQSVTIDNVPFFRLSADVSW